MKKILISVVILLIAGDITAQNALEAMRFNQTTFGGTARVLGVGGAFGAVGGDLSSAGINPAGLGLMRRNDFSGSLGFSNYRTTSDYIGSTQQAGRFTLNIPSFGIAGTSMNFHKGKEVKSGVVSNTFAFNYQRINNFQRNILMQGNNNSSSILDYYAELTTNNNWTPTQLDEYDEPIFVEELAWRTYLIDPVDPNNPNNKEYVAAINDSLTDVTQTNELRNKGAMSEMNFAYAMNISNRLYLGFGLNVLTARFEEINTFKETDNPNNKSNNYNSSESITDISTRGNGVNGKFGAIVKVNDYFRFGVNYQTATSLKLKDDYYYEINSSLDDGSVYSNFTPVQQWEYRLKIPAKLTASAAVIMGKHGFLSVDVEQVDYTQALISKQYEDYSAENNEIRSLYDKATNVRAGLEIVQGMFRFRTGMAYYETPYNERVLPNNRGKYSTKSYSLGAGIFKEEFYLDLALVNTRRTEFYSPYITESRQYYTAENKLSNTNLVITFGAKFD